MKELNHYWYHAEFEGNYPDAYGELHTGSAGECKDIVLGMCGTWWDENEDQFEGPCPVSVNTGLVITGEQSERI